jgi:hypothetical protein
MLRSVTPLYSSTATGRLMPPARTVRATRFSIARAA